MDSELTTSGSEIIKKIFNFSRRTEIRNQRLKKSEEERSSLRIEIQHLEKEQHELSKVTELQHEEIGKLKMQIFNFTEENSVLQKMDEEQNILKKDKDNKMWEIQHNAYSNMMSYCDYVQEFVEKYSLENMVNHFECKRCQQNPTTLLPYDLPKTIVERKTPAVNERKEKLKKEINKLSVELEEFHQKRTLIAEAQARRAELRYEPANGTEHVRLQALLKDVRDDIRRMEAAVDVLEKENQYVLFSKSKSFDDLRGLETTVNVLQMENQSKNVLFSESKRFDHIRAMETAGSSTESDDEDDRKSCSSSISARSKCYGSLEVHSQNEKLSEIKTDEKTHNPFIFKIPKYFKHSSQK